ncbi:MAG: type II toxin-antitoxin system RelE/ParE family toxin [Flavobacteriales bacterium]|nr:type II toxin-antitoxin system RelE/ParE family toxin [Flavobacteriales bacterium]
MSYRVIPSPAFIRELKRLSKKYRSLKDDVAALGEELAQDAFIGTPIGRGCYKVRMAIGSKGKGKSGGARVITYVRVVNKVVVLLTMYDKSEKENITERERDHLILLAEAG